MTDGEFYCKNVVRKKIVNKFLKNNKNIKFTPVLKEQKCCYNKKG